MSYYVSGYYQEKAILKKEGTTGNSSDLCELRKEKEDDSR